MSGCGCHHKHSRALHHHHSDEIQGQKKSICYLDGRYFNKVLGNYSNVLREALYVRILEDVKGFHYDCSMAETTIDLESQHPYLLRVVIEGLANNVNGLAEIKNRHSNLVIIDPQERSIWRFEPFRHDNKYFLPINDAIRDYLTSSLAGYEYITIRDQPQDGSVPSGCDEGGLCLAYVLKYGKDYLEGRDYDPSNIEDFALSIEEEYGPLTEEDGEEDIEYGHLDNSFAGALVGGLGGATIGGLLGGTRGAVVGGLGGAALGSLFGSGVSPVYTYRPYDYYYYPNYGYSYIQPYPYPIVGVPHHRHRRWRRWNY